MADKSSQKVTSIDALTVERGYGSLFYGMHGPSRKRIVNVLLVSSLYDLYLF